MNDIAADLAALATTAPPGLAESVQRATRTGRFFGTVPGPTGDLVVGWSTRGIYGVAPASELDAFLDRHSTRGHAPLPGELPAKLAGQVERALTTGKLGSLAIDLSALTEFQRAVLAKTAEIPPGQIRPYGWVAREIGKPGATRAVGSALNKNPVPVLMPCHRVGRSDGSVGEYAFGPEMKRELLRHEGLDPDEVDELATSGVRFIASATTGIYCLPTCHNARRIREGNRVELTSPQQAADSAMRPCKVCRPAAAAA